MDGTSRQRRVLAIDVGGTSIKAATLTSAGRRVSRVLRDPTPRRATPRAVLDAVAALARRLPAHGRVALGFPGVVRDGVVWTAPNLAPGRWRGVPFGRLLARRLGLPVRIANDAVLHGLGAARGRGVELLLALGTGLGSALFVDGRPVPLELGHLPWRRGRTYEQLLGEAARRRAGTPRWLSRVREALACLRAALQPDRVYLGGGNARLLPRRLPAGLARVSSEASLHGAARLWSGAARAASARVSARGR